MEAWIAKLEAEPVPDQDGIRMLRQALKGYRVMLGEPEHPSAMPFDRKPGLTPYPLPAWKSFSYPLGSAGYRIGRGEDYWCAFRDWFRALNVHEQARFAEEFPEPLDWMHFYALMALNPDDPAWDEAYNRVCQSQLTYLSEEVRRGRAAEKIGSLSQAVQHYRNVIHYGVPKDKLTPPGNHE